MGGGHTVVQATRSLAWRKWGGSIPLFAFSLLRSTHPCPNSWSGLGLCPYLLAHTHHTVSKHKSREIYPPSFVGYLAIHLQSVLLILLILTLTRVQGVGFARLLIGVDLTLTRGQGLMSLPFGLSSPTRLDRAQRLSRLLFSFYHLFIHSCSLGLTLP